MQEEECRRRGRGEAEATRQRGWGGHLERALIGLCVKVEGRAAAALEPEADAAGAAAEGRAEAVAAGAVGLHGVKVEVTQA